MRKNKHKGLFKRMMKGDARAVYGWASAMMAAGHSYQQAFEAAYFRTRISPEDFNALFIEGIKRCKR